jgi:hypothetical protein
MAKMIVFWILTLLSIAFLVGGGIWLFFWAYAKAKKNKMF